MITRKNTPLDTGLVMFDSVLRTLFKTHQAKRLNPALTITELALTTGEKKDASGCMRVNHAGEIAAQALYQGQALGARTTQVKKIMQVAADEEIDHLVWCEQRLQELGSHTSYLAPLWYMGAFTIGTIAGLAGDAISLGFLAETEKQVVAHLENDLERLPASDIKSRSIVRQMQADENQHANMAEAHGAQALPKTVCQLMKLTAKIMTTTAYYV